jgi:hypothetical protein
MRWSVLLGLALVSAACRQTVVFDQTGRDGGGGVGGTGGGSSTCSGPLTEFNPESPEVIVVLDRSTGMNTRFGDSTPLVTAREALDQFAAKYQKVVRYGYVEFPGTSMLCSPQCTSCPGTVSAPNPNFEAFRVNLHACDQSCSDAGNQSLRPTAAALASCGYVLSRPTDGSQRYVLLITNGRPDCGTGQNAGCTDAKNAVNALANSNANIRTLVVAPGQLDFDTMDCMDGLALAGGANKSPSPYYYPASNQSDLSAVIADITHNIATDACHLSLPYSPVSDGATVLWKNTKIPHDRDYGWDWDNRGFEIILHGQWCDHLLADGPMDFAVYASCNPPHP